MFQRSMEGLLVHDSCSSSKEGDESLSKKPKVTESDNIIIDAGSKNKTENGKLDSPLESNVDYFQITQLNKNRLQIPVITR